MAAYALFGQISHCSTSDFEPTNLTQKSTQPVRGVIVDEESSWNACGLQHTVPLLNGLQKSLLRPKAKDPKLYLPMSSENIQ